MDMDDAHARDIAPPSVARADFVSVASRSGARARRRPSRAFSLIELVIVITIIALISAIAIRRLSRHADQAASSGLAADLSVLQLAIERYRAEHAGLNPTAASIEDQLTKYTDAQGAVSPTTSTQYVYGPYVR